MATEAKPEIKKPEKLDLEKGKVYASKIIKKHNKWLKEMANR